MKAHFKIPIFLLIALWGIKGISHAQKIDSLKLALKNASHDTARCNILNALAENMYPQEGWQQYNEQLKELSEKNSKQKGELNVFYMKHYASSLNNIGVIYDSQGDFAKSLDYYTRSLKVREEIGDKQGIATSLNNIGFAYRNRGDIAKAMEYLVRSLKIQEEIGDKKVVAASLNNIGLIYKDQGDVTKALEYYNRSLTIQKEIGNMHGLSNSLNNIAQVYYNQGDIATSLEYFGRSLKIKEETGDKQGIALSLNNIGSIYSNQGETAKALDYYSRSLKIREETGDKPGIAESLNSIGVIYKEQGDLPKALEYFGRSLKLREETGNKKGVAQCYSNIGLAYSTQGTAASKGKTRDELFSKALDYYNRALKIREELGDKQGVAFSLNFIGHIYYKQNNYSKALEMSTKSLLVSRELGYPENIQRNAQLLSDIYQRTNRPEKALEMYKLYIQMRDSIVNTENKKKSIRQQFRYEYEKKAASDSVVFAKSQEVKNAEIAKQKAEITAKRNQQYFLFGGLALVMVFAGFMYNRFRVTQKQKRIIEEQKELVEKQKLLVEEKQKEVMDSINYAKRIQTALLPSEKYIFRILSKLQNKK